MLHILFCLGIKRCFPMKNKRITWQSICFAFKRFNCSLPASHALPSINQSLLLHFWKSHENNIYEMIFYLQLYSMLCFRYLKIKRSTFRVSDTRGGQAIKEKSKSEYQIGWKVFSHYIQPNINEKKFLNKFHTGKHLHQVTHFQG